MNVGRESKAAHVSAPVEKVVFKTHGDFINISTEIGVPYFGGRVGGVLLGGHRAEGKRGAKTDDAANRGAINKPAAQTVIGQTIMRGNVSRIIKASKTNAHFAHIADLRHRAAIDKNKKSQKQLFHITP